jgi:hypothetical protein
MILTQWQQMKRNFNSLLDKSILIGTLIFSMKTWNSLVKRWTYIYKILLISTLWISYLQMLTLFLLMNWLLKILTSMLPTTHINLNLISRKQLHWCNNYFISLKMECIGCMSLGMNKIALYIKPVETNQNLVRKT